MLFHRNPPDMLPANAEALSNGIDWLSPLVPLADLTLLRRAQSMLGATVPPNHRFIRIQCIGMGQ